MTGDEILMLINLIALLIQVAAVIYQIRTLWLLLR